MKMKILTTLTLSLLFAGGAVAADYDKWEACYTKCMNKNKPSNEEATKKLVDQVGCSAKQSGAFAARNTCKFNELRCVPDNFELVTYQCWEHSAFGDSHEWNHKQEGNCIRVWGSATGHNNFKGGGSQRVNCVATITKRNSKEIIELAAKLCGAQCSVLKE